MTLTDEQQYNVTPLMWLSLTMMVIVGMMGAVTGVILSNALICHAIGPVCTELPIWHHEWLLTQEDKSMWLSRLILMAISISIGSNLALRRYYYYLNQQEDLRNQREENDRKLDKFIATLREMD